MRIANNISALTAWRHFSTASQGIDRSIGRLSSGLRINTAADDVAGLAVAERMRTQIRGNQMAMRNIQDGISLVQVAESALNEMTIMMQRGRELAVQAANGVWTPEEKASLQTEIDQILVEVDRISDSTEFNGRKLLGGSNMQLGDLVEGLRRSWLANAESLVENGYGLTADDVSIKIIGDATSQMPGHPAYVSGTYDASGKMTNLELHIDLNWAKNPTLPNGGSYPQYIDRVVAHEVTHAVMARNMDFKDLPDWFREGTAEFIAGADDRLQADLAAAGGAANLVNEIDAWTGTSADYSTGYAAVKYLHSQIIAAGNMGGMKDLMADLKSGMTLDAAIAANTGYANTATFVADFKGANGQTFINGLNLADADVGAIGGGTAESVVPDTDTDTWNPLQHFKEEWPASANKPKVPTVVLQVGANQGETVTLPDLNADSFTLGLTGTDLIKQADKAIGSFDSAIRQISTLRGQLGSIQNRLEHTHTSAAVTSENLTAAESRIRDADMAHEMSSLTKFQLLTQSYAASLAQANNLHREAIRTLIG